MNRFPGHIGADRKYFNFDGAEPQYGCSATDCGAAAWTPEEHHACIGCSKRFCADHLIAIGGEKYCAACAKCACGELAIDSCNECGALQCGKCLGDFNECKPCRKTHLCICCANGQHESHLIGGAKCDCACHPSNQRKAKSAERKPAAKEQANDFVDQRSK
jgi:hypothetical protein